MSCNAFWANSATEIDSHVGSPKDHLPNFICVNKLLKQALSCQKENRCVRVCVAGGRQ